MSKLDTKLVAAKTSTFEELSKPSNSTNNWFKVLFLSELFSSSLLPPIASISSIKIIQVFDLFALLNNFRILDAPIPTYFSINSEPHADITGIFKLAAIVFTNNV